MNAFKFKSLITLCLFAAAIFPAFAQTSSTSFQYDAQGNLTQITDPMGRVTNQSFDAFSRVTQQLQPPAAAGGTRPAINFTYDGQDHLTKVTDPRNLNTIYTVNGLGNQTALASPDTGTANNTFDENGNVKTSTDARGKTTTYTYDALNRLSQASTPTGVASAFTYDSSGAAASAS